jgi:hypothetical protein
VNGIYYDLVSGAYRYVSNPGRVVIGGFWLDVPLSEKVNEGLNGKLPGRWIIGGGIRSIYINQGLGVGDDAANGGGETNPWALASVGAIALAADDVTGIGAVDDIAIPFLYAAAATYDLTQRVFVTYTLTNSSGQKYVGRASGFGDPTSVMMRRYAGHHMQMYGYGNPTLDVWVQGAQGYPAIRGREQQLLDFYGGVPNTGNSIRGVGYYNPMGRVYHGASNLYFGPLAPYTGY